MEIQWNTNQSVPRDQNPSAKHYLRVHAKMAVGQAASMVLMPRRLSETHRFGLHEFQYTLKKTNLEVENHLFQNANQLSMVDFIGFSIFGTIYQRVKFIECSKFQRNPGQTSNSCHAAAAAASNHRSTATRRARLIISFLAQCYMPEWEELGGRNSPSNLYRNLILVSLSNYSRFDLRSRL